MKRIITILLATLLVLSFAATWGEGKVQEGQLRAQNDTVTISRAEYDRLKQYAKLDEVKQYIENYYYEEVEDKALIDGAIQGLLSGTKDAYTFYYPEEAWKTLWEDDEGKYAGIGVQMLGDYDSSVVTIIRVFKNTPAEAAGLRKGDVFYKVEDIEVTTSTMQDAVNVMRGVPGEEVHVEILRDGTVMPFDIIKAEIVVNRVESTMLQDNIGYIALYEFAGGSYEDFKAAFDDLTRRGMKALVLDLRDNGGGWVDDGVRLADLFLDKSLLYYTEDRADYQEKSYVTDGKSDIPLVLLINEHSASTTEIVSAGLKDYDRATLVGTKTFGKGIIQDVRWLSDGKTGFQYTVAEYFSPKGNRVHEEGVTPDIEVEMPEELKSTYFQLGDMSDPQLKAAFDEAVRLATNAK